MNADEPERLWGKRQRLLFDEICQRGFRPFTVEQVEHDLATKAGTGNAQAGIANGVGDPTLHCLAPKNTEPATGVDCPTPGMGELETLELRERREEVLTELGPGLWPTLELGIDFAPPKIDRVVPAPQNSVVLGEPVIVKLVGNIAEPLAQVPADVRHLRR